MASALEIGVTAWSPLGGGVLTGKYNKNNKDQLQQEQQRQQQNRSLSTMVLTEGNSRLNVQNDLANRFLNDRNILIAQEVSKMAKEIGSLNLHMVLLMAYLLK
jgi:aryl-alcohol dehydrogenase-like predicted oxidoreductase